MKCAYEVTEWKRYVLGEIDVLQQESMEKHLVNCPSCLQAYEEVLLASITHLEEQHGPAPDISEQVWTEITDPIASVASLPNKKRFIFSFIHYGVAASIAIFLLHLGFFDFFNNFSPITQFVGEQSDQFLSEAGHSSAERIKGFANLFMMK